MMDRSKTIAQYLYDHGPSTMREIAKTTGINQSVINVTMLRVSNLFKKTGKRKCYESGRIMFEWDVTMPYCEYIKERRHNNKMDKEAEDLAIQMLEERNRLLEEANSLSIPKIADKLEVSASIIYKLNRKLFNEKSRGVDNG